MVDIQAQEIDMHDSCIGYTSPDIRHVQRETYLPS